MRTVTAFEAKTHLSALLDQASRGEAVLITRRGEPVAELGPVRNAGADARSAMEFLLAQRIRLGIPLRRAKGLGRRR